MTQLLDARSLFAITCCGLSIWFGGERCYSQAQPGFGGGAIGGVQGGAMSVQIDGTLVAGDARAVRVQQKDGSMIAVALPTTAGGVEYVVELKLAELRPGFLIRFSTDMTSLQAGAAKPENVELFAEEDRRNMNARNPRDRSRFMPGIYPLAQLGEALPQSTEVRVVGQIVGAKDDKTIIVNAGRQVLVEMAEDAPLSYRSNSLRLAKPGDAVSGNGITYNLQSGQVLASRITVTAAAAQQTEDSSARRQAGQGDEQATSEMTPQQKKAAARKRRQRGKSTEDTAAEKPNTATEPAQP